MDLEGLGMKTLLRVADHQVIPGARVFEVWYDGNFIAEIVGADGPGVRVISKFGLTASEATGLPSIIEVKVRT